MSGETERSSSTKDLRQGDILKFESPGEPRSSPDLGVIINADCDLAHQKIDGVIAYLPIYRFRSFLETFWAADYINETRRALVNQVRTACSLSVADASNLERWLAIADPEAVAEKLAAEVKMKSTAKAQLVDRLVKIRRCMAAEEAPFDVFIELCRVEADPVQHARKQVATAKKAIGDGHFFVSEIVGEPNVGFIIRMRRIYTIDAAACFTSYASKQVKAADLPFSAVRVASLTPMYQYKVAQLFAQQFSRIGLPDAVTALSELAIDDIVVPLFGGTK